MHTGTRGALAIALLLVTAGCLGAPGTALAPDGGGALDADDAAAAHESALASAGSYTVTVAANATVGGSPAGDSRITAAVSPAADRARLTSTTQFAPVVSYLENGTLYQRVGTTNPQYRTTSVNLTAADVVSLDVRPLLANHSFDATGRTTREGASVRRYVATATGENATLRADFGPNVTVTSVTVTLLIRDDGLIQSRRVTARLRVGATAGTYERSVAYTAVGATAVSRPDWIGAARNATRSHA
ncbi:MAG: hypothetical protein ABEJ77_07315 [Halanaeroarchaeum sp.]